MTVYAGLDIGGTKLLIAVADQHGTVLRRVQNPTPAGLDEGLELLDHMISEVVGQDTLAGIGVAIGGPLDWGTGVVSPLHQPTWRDLPLKKLLGDRWHCPAYIDVDTNVAALGEYCSAAETAARFLYLTLSTGMGGGFIVDGNVYRGSDGSHPEPAHISINARCANPSAHLCECGVADCLEALVSGNGIRRVYGKPAEHLDETQWEEVAWNLGQGLRNLATLYCPDVISMGGGICHARGESLIGPARAIMKGHMRLVRPPVVRLSKLGYETALVGAIHIAIHGLHS